MNPARRLFVSKIALLVGVVALVLFVIPTVWFPLQLGKLSLFLGALFVALLCVLWARPRFWRLPGSRALFVVALLPVAYLVSYLLSIDRSVGFLGYNLETDTLAGALALSLSFVTAFLVVRSPQQARSLLSLLAWGSGIAAVFQLILIFGGGGLLSFAFFADHSSNLVGKWNDLGLLAGLLLIYTTVRLEFGEESRRSFILSLALGFVLLVLLAIVHFILAWALLLCAGVLIAAVRLVVRRSEGGPLPILPVLLAVVAGLYLFLGPSINVLLTDKLSVSSLEVRPSWQSTSALQSAAREGAPLKLLFGTGPNTFGQEWLLHKPTEVNQSQFWNLDFNVGYSTLATALGSVGVLGAIALSLPFLLVLYFGWRVFVGRRRGASAMLAGERTVVWGLVVASAYFFAAMLFYVPSQNVLLLGFIIFGGTVGLLSARMAEVPDETSLFGLPRVLSFVPALFVLVLVGGLIVHATGRSLSEVYVNQGLRALGAGDPDQALVLAAKAGGIEKSADVLRLTLEAGTAKLQALATSDTQNADIPTILQSTVAAGQAAVALNPNDYRPHYSLAQLYSILAIGGVSGAYEGAIRAFQAAAEHNPSGPQIALAQARLEGARGNANLLDISLKKALELKPNYTDAILLAVQVAVSRNDLQGAIAGARAAVQSAPQNPALWFELGLLYYSGGDSATALQALEQAVTLQPDYANAKYFLGLSYAAQGRSQDAVAQFEALAVSNPDSAEVSLILNNLKSGKAPFDGAKPPVTPTPEDRSAAPLQD